ncbi:Serpentine receptor class gamma [Caenorhabditis elegans]|uniref:Serpentine receptor class gamma n=1 Tax=Caenorhabditis elegans TaxID=6239 RepID=O76701_CAEEL|nr:Serpentine receptor class gamma [Caenorhabditis elegans]CCD70124.2 Serpentine receptor class gamma [Caenorhabditis elegans]|eukprot:NP_505235.3 Uncharacterized protein CELE_ZC190.6 [Caenorhabditis elegans]
MRLYVWSLLHEFAFALHSFSIQMFSLERYITAKQTITQSVRNQVLSITLGVIISILSMCYAQIIHLVDFHVIAITIMNLVDMSALVILIISSQYSIQNYRKTAGIASLEKRFQISDVYIWTQAIIPVACIAFLIHFTFVIVVWLLSTLENSRYYQMTFSHYFENITSVFTICVPFLVVYKHKRIKKTKLLNRSRIGPQNQVRTLDGKTIQMRETIQDHFNFLKNTWK